MYEKLISDNDTDLAKFNLGLNLNPFLRASHTHTHTHTHTLHVVYVQGILTGTIRCPRELNFDVLF